MLKFNLLIYSKGTKIFCLVDEFCKEFSEIVAKSRIRNKAKRPSIRSQNDVITIAIIFQLSGFRTFKNFYVFYVKNHMKDDFPTTVSYNRFTELIQHNLMAMTLFLKTCCLGDCSGISFIDTTPIRVCKNKHIYNHKVFKGIATTGKSTMGWFYRFELHIIINDKGEVLKFTITRPYGIASYQKKQASNIKPFEQIKLLRFNRNQRLCFKHTYI